MLFNKTGPNSEDRRAAVYRRVSSQAQVEEGRSLDRDQVRICLDLIESNKLTMEADFAEAHSAKTGRSAKRPVFNGELLPYIKQHGIKHLVVAHIDRITRDAKLDERGRILGFLQNQEVTIYSPQGVLDLSTSTGRLLVQILMELAAAENERRSGSIVTARDGAFEQGIYHSGTVPYGYRLVKAEDLTSDQAALFNVPDDVAPPSFLVPDQAEVRQLQSIVERLIAGESGRAIALDLNERGIPQNVHRKTPTWWNSQSIRKMVRAPVRRSLVARKGNLVEAVNVVPIIDEPTYQEVAAHLSATARKDKAKGGRNTVLGGLLRCGHCGATLWRVPVSGHSKKYYYYQCSRARQHRGCDAPRIAQELALQQLARFLPALVSPRLWQEKALRSEIEVAEAQRELDLLDAQIDRLMDAHFGRQVLAADDFDRQYVPKNKRREELKGKLEAAAARFAVPGTQDIDAFITTDHVRLQMLLSAVVDHIEILDGNIRKIAFQRGLNIAKELRKLQKRLLMEPGEELIFIRFDAENNVLEIIIVPPEKLAAVQEAVEERDWERTRQAAADALGLQPGSGGSELLAETQWMGRYRDELPPGKAYKKRSSE